MTQVTNYREIAEIVGGGQMVTKTVAATASGSTALWTPAAGKKFHLLGYYIEVTGIATQAGSGILTIDLLDNATTLAQTHSVFVSATTPTTAVPDVLVFSSPPLGYGYLSSTVNNVLNVNLSAALTAGTVRVT